MNIQIIDFSESLGATQCSLCKRKIRTVNRNKIHTDLDKKNVFYCLKCGKKKANSKVYNVEIVCKAEIVVCYYSVEAETEEEAQEICFNKLEENCSLDFGKNPENQPEECSFDYEDSPTFNVELVKE
jgi:hypothetical protein